MALKVDERIGKRFDELTAANNSLKTDIAILSENINDSRAPQIIRQLVFELRIAAINKEFPRERLDFNDRKYKKANGQFDHLAFTKDYEMLKQRIRNERMTESSLDLNCLFNFNLQVWFFKKSYR